MEAQTLLSPAKPPTAVEKPALCGIATAVLTLTCVILACTLVWYHVSMQPKGDSYAVRIFALTRDVKAATAEFTGPVLGQLTFAPSGDYISITGRLTMLVPGVVHGVHILSVLSEDGVDRNAFHFDTEKMPHGCPSVTPEHHSGDLGNLSGDETGSADVTILTKAFSLSEVLGRVVAITEGKDLCTTAEDGKILVMAALAAAQPKKTFLNQ